MNNKTYDFLKWVALILLPAAGAAYFGLAQIWGLPNAEEIVGTITIVDTFLGALLKIQSNNYRANPDGVISINGSPEDEFMKMELNHDPETLAAKDRLDIKVKNNLS